MCLGMNLSMDDITFHSSLFLLKSNSNFVEYNRLMVDLDFYVPSALPVINNNSLLDFEIFPLSYLHLYFFNQYFQVLKFELAPF
jgi:hypothetical protein